MSLISGLSQDLVSNQSRADQGPLASDQPAGLLASVIGASRDIAHRWVDLVTMASALFGVGLYLHEGTARQEAHDTAAWQILALQQDLAGNGGRLWAMQVLVADQIDLHGVHLKNADFTTDGTADGASLDGARLDGASLLRSNLGRAHLHGAHLHGAALTCTALGHADLSGADLSQADLSGADVTAADFTGAKLDGALLGQACVKEGAPSPLGLPVVISRVCRDWGDAGERACKDPAP